MLTFKSSQLKSETHADLSFSVSGHIFFYLCRLNKELFWPNKLKQ